MQESCPSEHNISESGFLKNHGGSISHNFFEMESIDEKRKVRLPHSVLSFSNTNSNDYFLKTCREKSITPHPARMNGGLINFFIIFSLMRMISYWIRFQEAIQQDIALRN